MIEHGEQNDADWTALVGAPERDAPIDDPEFQRRLLADFDGVMRSRRTSPLAALADAFGWRALARPLAPAALAAAIVMLGVVVGALSAPVGAADEQAYVFLTAGLDPAADFSAEVASWAEQ